MSTAATTVPMSSGSDDQETNANQCLKPIGNLVTLAASSSNVSRVGMLRCAQVVNRCFIVPPI